MDKLIHIYIYIGYKIKYTASYIGGPLTTGNTHTTPPLSDKVIEVKGDGGLLDSTRSLDFLPGLHLEGYPNRDSTEYASIYGIEEADTILRGTLRYDGFSQVRNHYEVMSTSLSFSSVN